MGRAQACGLCAYLGSRSAFARFQRSRGLRFSGERGDRGPQIRKAPMSRTRPTPMPAFAPAEAASGAGKGATTLKVGAALPDPPFEFVGPEGPAGFDIVLMQHIAGKL